jgi:hypothetical protein
MSSDLIDARQSSIFCGVAGRSPSTSLYEQSVAIWKSRWQADAGAIGLNVESFQSSAIASNTFGGL